jgi:hypothetical protein
MRIIIAVRIPIIINTVPTTTLTRISLFHRSKLILDSRTATTRLRIVACLYDAIAKNFDINFNDN